MKTRQLSGAILDGGIRSHNLFKGRLLASGYLCGEQDVNREVARLLRESSGEGDQPSELTILNVESTPAV